MWIVADEDGENVRPKVYIETSVISYYTAWPSRDLIVAGHQQVTCEWWHNHLPNFDAYISELVLNEIGGGDPKAAKARQEAVFHIPILDVGDDSAVVAQALVDLRLIPQEFVNDAMHISIAAVNGIEYLATWNCRHLANAFIRANVESAVKSCGYECPVICTPEELMGDMS